MNMNEWIDVDSKLADILPYTFDDIDPYSTSILLSNGPYTNMWLFNPFRFILLEELIIGNYCFENVELFNINGLNYLKSLKIGENSFTKEKDDAGDDTSRSFSILNCGELESIEIGRFSFSDYGGGFELKNLPKLSTIKIGEIGSESANFWYSSFEIKGIIDMILLMNRSSIFEFHWIRLCCILLFTINSDIRYLIWMNDSIIDLPHLNSIKLGAFALGGRYGGSSCSLKMESDIDMNEFIFRSS